MLKEKAEASIAANAKERREGEREEGGREQCCDA
jgi:hypothetical protein